MGRRTQRLAPARIEGRTAWALWGLRVYIVLMLAVVAVATVHGR